MAIHQPPGGDAEVKTKAPELGGALSGGNSHTTPRNTQITAARLPHLRPLGRLDTAYLEALAHLDHHVRPPRSPLPVGGMTSQQAGRRPLTARRVMDGRDMGKTHKRHPVEDPHRARNQPVSRPIPRPAPSTHAPLRRTREQAGTRII